MPRTDAVLFDLDGTLCVHQQDGEALLERTFDSVGVEPFTDQRGLRAATNQVPDADSTVEFVTQAFAYAARQAGADPTPAPAIAETYIGMIDNSAVEFRDGAREALESVGDRPVGLVTNGDPDHQLPKLRALGIESAFDAIVYGGTTTPAKPSTVPFEQVLDTLGVAAADAIHVGNSLSDDVVGANRAGVRSVWVPTAFDRDEEIDEEPTVTLDSLGDLPTVY